MTISESAKIKLVMANNISYLNNQTIRFFMNQVSKEILCASWAYLE